MTFHTYAELGKQVASKWGSGSSSRDARTDIENMGIDSMSRCLLAAAVDLLDDLVRAADRLERAQATDREIMRLYRNRERSRADAMLHWMCAASGDVPITSMDQSQLPVRAQKALWRGKFKFLSQVTEESLSGLDQCGATTIHQIMEWKAKHVAPLEQPTVAT